MNYSAIGAEAEIITQKVSRHAFGPETPFDRMIALDAVCVSVAREPGYTATVCHHAELAAAVPYRYTKEFIHPVVRNGEIFHEPFYLHVQYRNSDVQRCYQERLMPNFQSMGLVTCETLGRSRVWGYSMREYYSYLLRCMVNDPYIWCKFSPKQRPWQLG